LDKLEYIEKAPEYYALGIVLGLLNFELTGTRAGTIRHCVGQKLDKSPRIVR
jgi:hypothetical protein